MILLQVVWDNTLGPELMWVLNTETRLQMLMQDFRRVVMELQAIKLRLGGVQVQTPGAAGARIIAPTRNFLHDPTKRK